MNQLPRFAIELLNSPTYILMRVAIIYPGWLQRVEVASVSVHLCTRVVWGLRATVLALRKGMHTGVVQRPTPVTYRYNICRLAPTTQPWIHDE